MMYACMHAALTVAIRSHPQKQPAAPLWPGAAPAWGGGGVGAGSSESTAAKATTLAVAESCGGDGLRGHLVSALLY